MMKRNLKAGFKDLGNQKLTLTFDLAFVNTDLKTVTEAGDFDVMIGDKKVAFSYK